MKKLSRTYEYLTVNGTKGTISSAHEPAVIRMMLARRMGLRQLEIVVREIVAA